MTDSTPQVFIHCSVSWSEYRLVSGTSFDCIFKFLTMEGQAFDKDIEGK